MKKNKMKKTAEETDDKLDILFTDFYKFIDSLNIMNAG